jgi:hypothetical protein
VLRALLRLSFKTLIRPPFGVGAQRFIVGALARLMPAVGGVHIDRQSVDGMPAEVISHQGAPGQGPVVLYLHGGGFCVGSARTHRSVTTRLAAAGMTVWVPSPRCAGRRAVWLPSLASPRCDTSADRGLRRFRWRRPGAEPGVEAA